MGKYRKIPVVIEAMQIIGPDNVEEIAAWCGGDPFTLDEPDYGTKGPHGVAIDTLEGTMHGEWGDWIIKGVEGEFYPCKPNIFAKTYEEVNDGPPQADRTQGPEEETAVKPETAQASEKA